MWHYFRVGRRSNANVDCGKRADLNCLGESREIFSYPPKLWCEAVQAAYLPRTVFALVGGLALVYFAPVAAYAEAKDGGAVFTKVWLYYVVLMFLSGLYVTVADLFGIRLFSVYCCCC
jgi:hypothetical protein